MFDGSKRSIPSRDRTARVLAVSPLAADLLRLPQILVPWNWSLHEASSCREALDLLRCHCIPVLLSERDHPDGNWEELLTATTHLRPDRT